MLLLLLLKEVSQPLRHKKSLPVTPSTHKMCVDRSIWTRSPRTGMMNRPVPMSLLPLPPFFVFVPLSLIESSSSSETPLCVILCCISQSYPRPFSFHPPPLFPSTSLHSYDKPSRLQYLHSPHYYVTLYLRVCCRSLTLFVSFARLFSFVACFWCVCLDFIFNRLAAESD